MPAIRNLLILDELTLTHRRGRAKFRVAAPYRLAWNYGAWSRQLTVPVGADTNGPSIIPFVDDSLIGAAVHDYLASTPASGIGRSEADALDREIKRAGDVPHWRAWAIWAVLRALGWIKWHGALDSRNLPIARLDPAREPADG